MHSINLEPTPSPSTLFLQGEEMPFEQELLGLYVLNFVKE